jgi:hypothetical protein
MNPATYEVAARVTSFVARIEIGGETLLQPMKGRQFPLISNTATTGHKLQGCTLEVLLVNDWRYCKNWSYVVLSRVRTMEGLYMTQPLSLDLDNYLMDWRMTQMMKQFEKKELLLPSDDLYNIMQNTDYAYVINGNNNIATNIM